MSPETSPDQKTRSVAVSGLSQGSTAADNRPSRHARPKLWLLAVPALLVLVAAWGIYSVVWPPSVEPETKPASAAVAAPVTPNGQPLGLGPEPDPKDRLPLDPLIPETAAGQLAEAERLVNDLARRFPDNPDAHEMQARFHYEFGQVDQAVAAWKRCLELNPNYAYALIGLAQAAAGRGEHDQAVAYCRRAVLADPNRPSHQIDLGQALVAAGEIDEALEVLERVVRAAPASARAHGTLGAALIQKRDYDAAKASFEATLRLDPTHAQAHFGLATACARLGLLEQAREHEVKFREFRTSRYEELRGQRASYDDDRALGVDLAVRYTEVASVYLAEGRPTHAEQLWRRASRLDSENRECRQALAWHYLGQDKLRETILMLRELARLEPANPSFPAEIARLYGRLGRLDDAERTLRDFSESAPDNVAGHIALAEFYLNAKPQPALAVEQARKAVDLAGTAQHWVLLSAAHELAGELPAAVDALEHAVQLAPDNPQYRQLLALSKARAATPDAAGQARPIKKGPSTDAGALPGISPGGTTAPEAPHPGD